MRIGDILKADILFLTLSICFLSLAQGQETLTGLQREMERVEREIQREKKLHKLEKLKAKSFEARKKEKLDVLNTQLKKLADKVVAAKSKRAGVAKKKRVLKGQIQVIKNKRAQISKKLLAEIDSLSVYMQSDFPYQKTERLSALADLKKDIADEVIGPEEGMSRLFTLLQNAIAIGYDSEVYSGTYENTDGKFYDGKYVRLGTAIYCFSSLDGKINAYMIPSDSGYVWADKGLPMPMRQEIKKAIAVAEGKSAPELVLLPFGLNAKKGGE